MKHFPVARGVFFRLILLAVMLPFVAALGGCSLFGIATKGNLEDLAVQQEEQHQQLQSEVKASEQKMDGRVTQIEDKTRQLDKDLIRYETEIQSAKLQLQTIILDLEAFEEGLIRASNDSRQAMQIHHDTILSERDRIRMRLGELDKLIMSWGQQPVPEPAGTLTPVPSGLIIPEEQVESGSNTDVESASSETSVWKDRSSDSSSR